MNWTWIVGGIAAVGIVGAALYFFGIAAVAKLFGDVVRFVAGSISRFLAWVRKPGNGTKAVCAVLAVASLTFGIQSMQRGIIIEDQREEYAELQDKTAREKQELADAVSLRDQRIQEFQELARQQIVLLNQLKAENAKVVAEAAAARLAAAKSNAAYQAAFQKRPPECKAALEVMANACSTLKDY